MLYVLARTQADVEEWRRRVGLPRHCVRPITTARAVRGLRIDYNDIVKLDGWSNNREERSIRRNLAATGIYTAYVSWVSQA